MTIAQGILPFQLVADHSQVLMASFGGLPLGRETFRALGLAQTIRKHLPLHQRPGRYEEADSGESFISVFAAGGDGFDDFELLRQGPGLQKLGLKVPSPESARFFMNAFHEEERLQGRVPHEAFIPQETEWLQGLEEVHRDLIRKATLGDPPWQATIDLDALVLESDKREVFYPYLNCRGDQPVIADWAEQDLIVADQFRDGNVPAGTRLREVLQIFSLFKCLPYGV